ncbi:hypothetical protein [Streptomyces sp. NPDC047014]|uniref:hypothetical protein n=1 Tax=Streptomyces sp. NPDC047014 TaxID=3155736 RepID=UPI0033F1A153
MRTGSRAATALLALCCCATTACGGPPREGYAAVGAAAPGPERGAGDTVAPEAGVEFQQLGDPSAPGGPPASSGTPAPPPGSTPPGGPPPGGATITAPGGPAYTPGTPARPGTPPPAPGTPSGPGAPGTSGPPAPPPGPTRPTGAPTGPVTRPPDPPPSTPARLTLSAPARSAAPDRWCERVTVTFTNTGGTAARAGTVTFATHIIGALGVDWATITTTQPLPAPLAGGASRTQTYTVCVESWRVPLGMHVDTRKVTATWS